MDTLCSVLEFPLEGKDTTYIISTSSPEICSTHVTVQQKRRECYSLTKQHMSNTHGEYCLLSTCFDDHLPCDVKNYNPLKSRKIDLVPVTL